MTMRYALLILLMMLSAASARELTLEQALRLAEEHSHALKEAESDRLAAEKQFIFTVVVILGAALDLADWTGCGQSQILRSQKWHLG